MVVLVWIRTEFSVGEDGDGASNNVTMAVQKRKSCYRKDSSAPATASKANNQEERNHATPPWTDLLISLSSPTLSFPPLPSSKSLSLSLMTRTAKTYHRSHGTRGGLWNEEATAAAAAIGARSISMTPMTVTMMTVVTRRSPPGKSPRKNSLNT